MSDAEFFRSVVDQMHHGVPYYDAYARTLHAQHFAGASVFNWRPPFLYYALALFPQPLPLWMYFTEVWAGLFLGLAFLTRDCRPRSTLVLLAVSTRELALPVLAIQLWLAWRAPVRDLNQRDFFSHRLGRMIWSYAALYAALYYAGHWSMVTRVQLPNEVLGPSWLTLGGIPFLLSTFGVLLSPGWSIAWGLALCLALSLPWVDLDLRLTVAGYLGFYLVCGLPLNGYWGLVVFPLQAILLGQAVVNMLTTERHADRSVF